MSEEKEIEVGRRYLRGDTFMAMAKDFGCSSMTITRTLKNRGIENNRVSRLSREDEAEIVRLYVEGLESVAIAKRFGIYSKRVLRVLRKHEVPINRHRRITVSF